MTWVQIDDGMADHPKIMGLSHGAFRLQVEGLCYGNRNLSDGFVPFLAAHRHGKRYAAELVGAGVWDIADGGYVIHDFTDYQPSRDDVLKRRAETADRVRQWRRNKPSNAPRNSVTPPITGGGGNAVTNRARNAVSNGTPNPNPQPENPLALLNLQPQGRSGAESLTVRDQTIQESTTASIDRLLERLPDATPGTVGRLVNLAKAGACQADFEDARAQLAETRSDHPSRLACHIIQTRLAERQATA